MRRRTLALVAAPLLGCAGLIGATFDDARLGTDASTADALPDGVALPDVAAQDEEAEAAAPFAPDSLPSLALWLDATFGVETAGDAGSGPVTRWRDRSAYGRDAVPAGGGTNPPTLAPGAIAGNPVVHFTSSMYDLLHVSSWTGPDQPAITIFVVARGYPNSIVRFQTTVGQFPAVIFPIDVANNEASPSFRLDVGSSATSYVLLATSLDGGLAVSTARWSSDGTADTFEDGVLVEQRVGNAPLPNGQALNIGGVLPLSVGSYANGDVAEAIVYDSALDDASRAEVEAYLAAKWGVGP